MMNVYSPVSTHEYDYTSGKETEVLRDYISFIFIISKLSSIYNTKSAIKPVQTWEYPEKRKLCKNFYIR